MDHHNYMLDLFESFERHQTELEARDSLMVLNRDIQPKWEIQAFLNNQLQWADPAYDEDELQSLKNAATEAGFTYTVEPEQMTDNPYAPLQPVVRHHLRITRLERR